MSTDYIDRDLIPRSPRPARDASPSDARRAERAAALSSDQERLADLEREAAATKAIIEKQEAYDAEREEIVAAIDAALRRIADEKDRSDRLVATLDDAERDLITSQRLIDDLREEDWTDATRAQELDHALRTLDDVRAHYNDVAKRLQEAAASAPSAALDGNGAAGGLRAFFRSPNVRAGWAWALGAALPLALTLLALSIAWWIFLTLWW